jgi:hypothetical protein
MRRYMNIQIVLRHGGKSREEGEARMIRENWYELFLLIWCIALAGIVLFALLGGGTCN